MTVDDEEPQPLGGWDSAYGHFARALHAADPDRQGGELIQPALVRLRAGKSYAEARATVEAWLAEGLVQRDAQEGPLPEDDRPFTLYWSDALPVETEERLGTAVEVLSLTRRLDSEPLPAPAPVTPEAAGLAPKRSLTSPILAVIDDGIGFLNARFRTAQGTRTRFAAVWLMSFRSTPGGAGLVQAGRVLSRAEIDGWLALGPRLEEDSVYRNLNASLLEPGAHRATELAFSHGTHVLDAAAGADPGTGDPAETWPLLVVQLPPEAVDDTAGTHLEPMILRGLAWILAQAEAMGGSAPVITTVAMATFAGPKDGTKAIEAVMAQMVDGWSARTGRAARVVLSFGNARRTRQAARLTASATPRSLDWRILPDDRTASYLEIRTPDGADLLQLHLSVIAPHGEEQALPVLPPNSWIGLRDAGGHVVGRVYHIGPRVTAPGITSPAHLVLAMAPSVERAGGPVAPHGAWRLSFQAEGGAGTPLRLEVQRDDTVHGYRQNGRQSYLDDPFCDGWDAETADYGAPEAESAVTRAGTFSSFATAPSASVLVVAGAVEQGLMPSRYSAEGSPDLRSGPTLAALADRSPARPGLLAAGTLSGTVRTSDGTSVAAARAARALAMLYDTGPVPAPGAAETAALVAAFGVAADPAWFARLGAGVLNAPPPRA